MADTDFFDGRSERVKDGKVIATIIVTSFIIGKLSQKEVASSGSFVLTEKALYEFKGVVLNGKETRRISWDDFHGLILSKSKLGRFVPLLSTLKNTKTYEATEGIEKRNDFVQKLKGTFFAHTGSSFRLTEMEEDMISVILKAVSNGSTLGWPELIKATEDGTLSNTEEVKKIVDVRKSLRTTRSGSRKMTLGSSSEGEFVTSSIWNQLEIALEKPSNPEEVAAIKMILNKLQVICPGGSVDNGELGSPKDESHAMISFAYVLMDPLVCKSLVSQLLLPKKMTQDLLEDLEENLGHSKVLVRRWAALSFFASLPTFELCHSFPNSTGWRAATRLHADQVRNRENAFIRLLFPPLAAMNAKLSNNSKNDEDVFVMGVELVTSERKASNLSKSKHRSLERKSNLTSAPSGTKTSNLRRASNMITTMLTGNNATNALAVLEEDVDVSGGRRQRSTLALMWMSKLLDLEDSPNLPATATTTSSNGIRKCDIQTLFQLLLGKTPVALGEEARIVEFEVETFGAVVEFSEFFGPILACLTATRMDDVRCMGLKQLNVLIMRNAAATRAFLSVPDWQSIVFTALYNVPFMSSLRDSAQDDTYSYSLHMMTTLHLSVLGSMSHCSEFGPIDKLFGQTIYKLAVHSGWGEPTIAVVRSIFKGIFSSLAKQASTQTCTWRYNPMHDEWEEIFRLSHLLQTFLFYRPTHLGLRDMSDLVAKASKEMSSNQNLGPFTDWRNRITHVPLLGRVQHERLEAAHRQMYAKMGLPVMTAAHRGEETGIHLDEQGMCHDRSLVETAIKVWTALGISGNEAQDRKKSEELTSKADRSRILYASNVCRELMEVLKLFDMIDEKRAAVLKAATKTSVRKATGGSTNSSSPSSATTATTLSGQQKDQVAAIAHSKAQDFLYKQKTKEQNVGFLSKAKAKAAQMPIRDYKAEMLKKRENIVRKLGSGSDQLEAQVVPKPMPVPLEMVGGKKERPTLARGKSVKLHIRADEETMVNQAKSVEPLEEVSVFEENLALAKQDSNVPPARKTKVNLHKVVAPEALQQVGASSKDSFGKKRKGAPILCYGCDREILDELSEVQKFGQRWHAECVTCSNCNRLVMGESENNTGSGVLKTCRFYPLAELLLCSVACRDEVLKLKHVATRCAGCMDEFAPGEKSVTACGHDYHVNQCFRCESCDLQFDETRPFFEVQGSAYCAACIDIKFMRCKHCTELLLDTDKVVDVENWMYHDRCFNCSVCKESFKDDNFFMGQREGELLCFTHHYEQRTPPCAFCHLPFNPKVEGDTPVSLAGLNFHRHCLSCTSCSRKLLPNAPTGSDEAAEEHDGHLYCTDCYVNEFGMQCHRCKLGIKGDILHAGMGKNGETINWHPSCFVCMDCSAPLLDIPFFLVAVGDMDLVTVCNSHYTARYANKTCPGCHGFVSPSKNRLEPEEPLLPGMPRSTAASSVAAVKWNDNPAIMYDEKMWHARCLTCEDPDCGVGLYEEFSSMETTRFKVLTCKNKRVCATHYELGLEHCFTCKLAIGEDDEPLELMGWSFHDSPQCFCCSECGEPFNPGQAMIKLTQGPAHQSCPSKSAVSVGKKKSFLKQMSDRFSRRMSSGNGATAL